MIVFYIFLGLICFCIFIILSCIELEINNFEIKNIDRLKKILISVEENNYLEIFNYINFQIYIKIKICYITEITIIKIDEKKAKHICEKYMEKMKKEMILNPKEYRIKRQKQKMQLEKMRKRLNNNIGIEKMNLKIGLGLANAGTTGIIAGILNTLISIILGLYIGKDTGINIKNARDNIKYRIEPIYSENLEFTLNSSIKFLVPIYSIVKV